VGFDPDGFFALADRSAPFDPVVSAVYRDGFHHGVAVGGGLRGLGWFGGIYLAFFLVRMKNYSWGLASGPAGVWCLLFLGNSRLYYVAGIVKMTIRRRYFLFPRLSGMHCLWPAFSARFSFASFSIRLQNRAPRSGLGTRRSLFGRFVGYRCRWFSGIRW
jgi:hypothetical protein